VTRAKELGLLLHGRHTNNKTTNKKRSGRTSPKTENVYLRLLVRLYRFLARRTTSRFNKAVLKRLFNSRPNKPPISLSKIVLYLKGKKEEKIAVIVGTVTDDKRVVKVPKMSICALRFTESARARIVNAGGKCITFDQLALQRPKGTNCILMRGSKNREVIKHFGAAGSPKSHVKPYVGSPKFKGKKFEKASGV